MAPQLRALSLVAVLLAVLASANAQTCDFSARSAKSAALGDGECVVSSAYQASLIGSTNAIDQ